MLTTRAISAASAGGELGSPAATLPLAAMKSLSTPADEPGEAHAPAVASSSAAVEGRSAAGPLFATGASIWATNVIAFALWYWEFDRGGPVHRAHATLRHPDLMFPQMVSPQLASPDWEPQFVDYLYLAFTNATAFSPTDVMPLARWAKLTMLAQAAVSLSVGALVIARAVNILKYLPHRGARMIEKVLKSAMANAEDRGIRNVGDMIIIDARGDGGPMFKRLMPRARGMAYMIRRRTAHIEIGLTDIESFVAGGGSRDED